MEKLGLLEGLDLDGARPTGIGTHIITHHNFDPTTHEVSIHSSSSTHPTDLGKLMETIKGLVAEEWKLYQLMLVVTEGVGGARILAVLAKPQP